MEKEEFYTSEMGNEERHFSEGHNHGFFLGWFFGGLITLAAVRVILEITRFSIRNIIDTVGLFFIVANFIYLLWKIRKNT